MKIPPCSAPLALALTLIFGSCSKKADVNSQASELEKAFQATGVTAPFPTGRDVSTTSLPADANACVHVAVSAVRANDYAGGVIALQTVQRMPGVTADQLMAVERTKEAITADLVARAARGDAKAKAELAVIEKTRSQ